MAIYHLSVKPITRAGGRSATAAAAYRSGELVHDLTSDQVFDYTRKRGVEHSEIVLPTTAAKQDINWARDRQTRSLLALVCVHFEPGPYELFQARRLATALFEFRKGQWCADGKSLDEMRPDEAVGRNPRLEAVSVTPPNPRPVG